MADHQNSSAASDGAMQRLLAAAGWDAGSLRHKQLQDALDGAQLEIVPKGASPSSADPATPVEKPGSFRPCDGCDGHECDNECKYPGMVPHSSAATSDAGCGAAVITPWAVDEPSAGSVGPSPIRLEQALHEASVYGIGATSDTNQRVIVEAAKAIAAIRAEPQAAPDREAVAKIIDPAPWGSPWSYPRDWEGPEDVEAARQRAFAKADAILALSRHT